MLLLAAKAHPSVERMREAVGPLIGRLVTPRSFSNLGLTDYPWAADNDCFNGLNERAYVRMLDALPLAATPPLFVSVPDIVADADATDALWERWHPELQRRGLPPAYVLQDGCEDVARIPCNAAAVFIGGTTDYKLSSRVASIVVEAKGRGLHIMGRVNTVRRIRYASEIGCDSIDGTKWSRFTDTYLPTLQVLNFEQTALGDA